MGLHSMAHTGANAGPAARANTTTAMKVATVSINMRRLIVLLTSFFSNCCNNDS
jgi:hypothetical protein